MILRRKLPGLKSATEAMDLSVSLSGRGAFCTGRSHTARRGGRYRRENVGISSVKAGENPARRKPKVSWGRIVLPGLVRA